MTERFSIIHTHNTHSMKYLKLKTKLLTLVGVGFVILLLTGIISFATFQKVQNLKAESEIINQIATYTLKLRKHEKDFLTREVINPTFFETGDSKYLSKLKGDLSRIDSILVVLKKSSTIKENNHNQLINEMRNSFTTYKEHFSDIVDATKVKGFKDWGLVGELRNSVRTIKQCYTAKCFIK